MLRCHLAGAEANGDDDDDAHAAPTAAAATALATLLPRRDSSLDLSGTSSSSNYSKLATQSALIEEAGLLRCEMEATSKKDNSGTSFLRRA